jgi:hypothetical protein
MNTTPTSQPFGAAPANQASRPKMFRKTAPRRPGAPGSLRSVVPSAARAQAPVREKREPAKPAMVLLRHELGDVLRSARLRQRRTLRDVSTAAKVSLGYLSEIERGHKEASSELLASICEALDMPLWETLRAVADRLAAADERQGETASSAQQRLALVR